MTTYTPSLRLWEGTPGDPAIRNQWGTALNENDNLIEAAVLGSAGVSLAGLTTYTLTTANGAPDQARPLIQSYGGALTGACTVTLPNVPKFGYAVNNTTGGFAVILTSGAGVTATIPPNGQWYPFYCDGATNVFVVPIGSNSSSASAQLGDMKHSALGIEGSGWRLANGQARPQTDPLWVYIVANSLTAQWLPGFSGSSTYNLPNAQDLAFVGQDGMGGAASPGLLTQLVAGFDPTKLLNIGGSQHAQADSITITQSGAITATTTATDSGHTHPYTASYNFNNNTAQSTAATTSQSPTIQNSTGTGHATITATTTITNGLTLGATSGNTGASQNIQPSMIAAVLIYTGA